MKHNDYFKNHKILSRWYYSQPQDVINDKVKLLRAKWHFPNWHNCFGGSGIKIGEGWCWVMKFVCREWQMSPTMSPIKSDKNQPSKYIILAQPSQSRTTKSSSFWARPLNIARVACGIICSISYSIWNNLWFLLINYIFFGGIHRKDH